MAFGTIDRTALSALDEALRAEPFLGLAHPGLEVVRRLVSEHLSRPRYRVAATAREVVDRRRRRLAAPAAHLRRQVHRPGHLADHTRRRGAGVVDAEHPAVMADELADRRLLRTGQDEYP